MTRIREDILNKAIALFLQQGVWNVSMDEIAAYADVSKMTLYKYFDDKTGLLEQVGYAIVTHAQSGFLHVEDSEMTLTARMADFLTEAATFVDNGYYQLCIDLCEKSDKIQKAFTIFKRAQERILGELIEEGIVQHRFKPELDSRMIFDYINMGIAYYENHAPYREQMTKDLDFRDRMMRFLVGNIFLDDASVLEYGEYDGT